MKKYIIPIFAFLTLILAISNRGFSQAKTDIPQKKILIVVTSHEDLGKTGLKTGYYLSEVTHPYFQLEKAGLTIDIASPQGGKAPMDEKSRQLNDPDNKRFMETPKLIAKLNNSRPLSIVNPKEYSAILFAGGHGTMWDFPNNEIIKDIAAKIYESGGIVAAVCHGPAALINVKLSNGKYLIDGKCVAAFTNQEEDTVKLTNVVPFSLENKLLERGANITKTGLWKENVVVSERLVTGQNPASAKKVGKEITKLLLNN